MATLYYYTARTDAGRFVQGSLRASSHSAALVMLRSRTLFVTSLQGAGTAAGHIAAALQGGGIPNKAHVAFFRSLATLVAAGVPMRRCLLVAAEHCTNSRLREAVSAVSMDIESGVDLSEALARRPREFNALTTQLVRAGEAGGVLDIVLQRIAALMERDYAVHKRLRTALAYPCVVACSALGLFVFLITGVVPMFTELYTQMNVELPAPTRLLIELAQYMHAPSTIALIAIIAVLVSVAAMTYGKRLGALVRDLAVNMPVGGPLLVANELAQISRLLGVLLQSGVPISAAIDLVASVAAIPSFVTALCGIREALSGGAALAQAVEQCARFDAMFVQLVGVGEETGSIDRMLLALAEHYDIEVESALGSLTALAEPATMLVVGAIVAALVGAIFVPLYSMIGSIR